MQVVEAQPNDKLVELLESILADARAGKIHEFAAVFAGNGKSGHASTIGSTNMALVGQFELLKLRIMANALEEGEEQT